MNEYQSLTELELADVNADTYPSTQYTPMRSLPAQLGLSPVKAHLLKASLFSAVPAAQEVGDRVFSFELINNIWPDIARDPHSFSP